MRAKIIQPGGYECMPNGYAKQAFAEGDIVDGYVAEWAVLDGAAYEVKIATPPETMRHVPQRGRKRK
jgi:hypothetical protein